MLRPDTFSQLAMLEVIIDFLGTRDKSTSNAPAVMARVKANNLPTSGIFDAILEIKPLKNSNPADTRLTP